MQRPNLSAPRGSRMWRVFLGGLLAFLLGGVPAASAAPPVQKPVPQKPKAAKATPKGAKGAKAQPKAQPKTQPKAMGESAPKSAVDSSKRETALYGDRLTAMETEVEELKDKIFRSKARLALLKETVLRGVMAGSRIIVAHRNVMSSQYRLTKVVYFLDGAQIFARNDPTSGTLDSADELVIFDGNLVPGPHTVTIELTYRGQGFGVFSYLNGYTFESRSTHSFTAPENGAQRLLSSGYEEGNMTTEMKDRPAVSWQEIALDASGKPASRAPRGKRGKASGSASAGTKKK